MTVIYEAHLTELDRKFAHSYARVQIYSMC